VTSRKDRQARSGTRGPAGVYIWSDLHRYMTTVEGEVSKNFLTEIKNARLRLQYLQPAIDMEILTCHR
jgi:hypothetical protein